MKIFPIILAYVVSVIGCHQESPEMKIKNNDFKSAINEYYKYMDSTAYDPGYYVIVNAEKTNDSLVLSIHYSWGSYNFFQKDVVDYLKYRHHEVLLTGAFPNRIIYVKKKKWPYIENIIKEKYPDEYKKFLNNPSSVGPIMSDDMEMSLVFKRNRMLSCKRQYY